MASRPAAERVTSLPEAVMTGTSPHRSQRIAPWPPAYRSRPWMRMAPLAARAPSIEPSGESSAPALACLTGDAPKRFALTKKTVTVGRGPQCDLQILTHFVSREHARITVTGGNVVIEDLGSRNGVYVNAVRVERHSLQQGDLITIGETQFRFMESMAH